MAIITTSAPRRGRKFIQAEDKVTTSFRISKSLWNRFGNWCKQHQISRSALVEQLIREETKDFKA